MKLHYVSRQAQKALAAASAGLVVLVAGCAWTRPHLILGTALRAYGSAEPTVGTYARDFAFKTIDGKVSRLSAVRGRVTVLVFPDNPKWPDCGMHRRLVKIAHNASVQDVEVVVVSVGSPEESCGRALVSARECRLPPEYVVFVCDPHHTVYRLYGENAVGRYYVLNNFLRIEAIGELGDLDGLRAAAQRVVDQVWNQDLRQGAFEDYDWD